MAEKRMFTKKIVDSDAFIDMPISARLLYYDLAMRADDDGFVNAPKKIMKFVGASVDDMSVLIARQFIIPFESGVVVIKHWLIHNYIRKDTYKETTYVKEKSELLLDENKSYSLVENSRQRFVDESLTQYSIDKNSIDKNSIEDISRVKESIVEDSETQNTAAPSSPSFYGKYQNVILSADDLETLKNDFPEDFDKRIEKLSAYMQSTGKTYKNHLATIQYWAEQDKEKQKNEKQTPKGQSGSNPFLTMAKNKGLI